MRHASMFHVYARGDVTVGGGRAAQTTRTWGRGLWYTRLQPLHLGLQRYPCTGLHAYNYTGLHAYIDVLLILHQAAPLAARGAH